MFAVNVNHKPMHPCIHLPLNFETTYGSVTAIFGSPGDTIYISVSGGGPDRFCQAREDGGFTEAENPRGGLLLTAI